MLILSRKVGETIVLAETILVSVVSLEKGRVRIGIRECLDLPILQSSRFPIFI